MGNILKISHLILREIDADNIKICLLEIHYEKVNWMKLTPDPKVRFCGDTYESL
jgi:hypothetical protein